MAAVSILPRVRTIVVCDDVFASPTEDGVFTLEGVRQHLVARYLPFRTSLSLFLLLSSPRKGIYSGKILLVNEARGKAIRYIKFVADFTVDHEFIAVHVGVADCVFPEAGQYSIEVYFSSQDGVEAL